MTPIIPSWLDDAGLSGAEFRLYCHLCRRADNETGIAWPSYETMMSTCSMSRATVARTISSLESKGLIQKEGRQFGGSTKYRVLSNSLTRGTDIVSPEERLEPNSLIRGTVCNSPIVSPVNSNRSPNETTIVSPEELKGIQRRNPKKVLNTKEEPFELAGEPTKRSKARQPEERPTIPEHLNTQEFLELWEEWRSSQKKNNPLTAIREKKHLKELAHPEVSYQSAISAVEKAIASGWKCVFPVHDLTNKKPDHRQGEYAEPEEHFIRDLMPAKPNHH